MGNYLYLPGTSGTYGEWIVALDLAMTSDLDIQTKVSLDDWSPSSDQTIVAKWLTTGNARGWDFFVDSTGALGVAWSTDGTAGTVVTELSSTTPGFTDGTTQWVRVTVDLDNGSSDSDTT